MRYGNDGVYTFIVIFNNDTERTIEGENIEEAMDKNDISFSDMKEAYSITMVYNGDK